MHTMRYDPEFTEYWSIMQIPFGSSAINVLCGPGHFGKVVDQIIEKRKFTPDEGFCNFAIPSCRTLSKLGMIGYDKEIPCGPIKHTLDIAEQQSKQDPNKQFTLTMDGKLLAEGSKGEHNGDVDLWG